MTASPPLSRGVAGSGCWQFIQGPGSGIYRLYDRLRRGVNRGLVAYLIRHVGDLANKRVLEAGSGPAFGSSLFARNSGVKLSVALDIDIEALREARRRDSTLPVVAGDLYHLPFAAGAFDLVWNSSTLEHLADPDPALAEMARVTLTGGHIFVGVPYRHGPLGFQPWLRNTRCGVWLGTVFTRDRLREMFARRGLVREDTVIYFLGFFIGILGRKACPPGLPEGGLGTPG